MEEGAPLIDECGHTFPLIGRFKRRTKGAHFCVQASPGRALERKLHQGFGGPYRTRTISGDAARHFRGSGQQVFERMDGVDQTDPESLIGKDMSSCQDQL